MSRPRRSHAHKQYSDPNLLMQHGPVIDFAHNPRQAPHHIAAPGIFKAGPPTYLESDGVVFVPAAPAANPDSVAQFYPMNHDASNALVPQASNRDTLDSRIESFLREHELNNKITQENIKRSNMQTEMRINRLENLIASSQNATSNRLSDDLHNHHAEHITPLRKEMNYLRQQQQTHFEAQNMEREALRAEFEEVRPFSSVNFVFF